MCVCILWTSCLRAKYIIIICDRLRKSCTTVEQARWRHRMKFRENCPPPKWRAGCAPGMIEQLVLLQYRKNLIKRLLQRSRCAFQFVSWSEKYDFNVCVLYVCSYYGLRVCSQTNKLNYILLRALDLKCCVEFTCVSDFWGLRIAQRSLFMAQCTNFGATAVGYHLLTVFTLQ